MQETKVAIYIQGLDKSKVAAEVKKLSEYIINDGCTLASPDHIFIDNDNSFKQLAKLVKQIPGSEIKAVYVVHDLLGEGRSFTETSSTTSTLMAKVFWFASSYESSY